MTKKPDIKLSFKRACLHRASDWPQLFIITYTLNGLGTSCTWTMAYYQNKLYTWKQSPQSERPRKNWGVFKSSEC